MKLPGLRTIKTALSVVICAITINLLNAHTAFEIEYFYAGIAAVFTLSTTHETSKERGKQRILGTIIGAIIALIFSIIRVEIFYNGGEYIFLFIELILCIYIIDLLKINLGVSVGCIVVIASYTNRTEGFVLYIILRTLETMYGVVVAILVNKYIFPYKGHNKEK